MYPQLPCLREYFALEGIADKHINEQQLQLRQDAGGTSGQITDATKEANNINDFAGGALVSEMNRLKARLGLTGSFHINSLIRQACDEAVYGYGFTFEGSRFIPATAPHRIDGGFAYAVGDRSRLPDIGRGSQGGTIIKYLDGGNVLQDVQITDNLIIAFEVIIGATPAGNTVNIGTNAFSGTRGYGIGRIGSSDKWFFNPRSDATNKSIIGNDAAVTGERHRVACQKTSDGTLKMSVSVNDAPAVIQTDTDTFSDLIESVEPFIMMARELSGVVSLPTDDKFIWAAVCIGGPDLTDAELTAIKSPYDLPSIFTEGDAWLMNEGAGDTYYGIFGNINLDATGHAPTRLPSETLRSFTNEVGSTKAIRFSPTDEFTDFGTTANASVGGTAKRTFKVKLVSFSFSTTQVYWQIFQVVGNNRAFQFGIDVFSNPFIVLSSDGEAGTTNSYFATSLTATINTNIELQVVFLPSDSVIFTLNGVSETVAITESGIFAASTSSLKQGSDIVTFDQMDALIYESSILDENDNTIIEPDFNKGLTGTAQLTTGSVNPTGTLTGGAAIIFVPLAAGSDLAVFGLPPTGLPNIAVAQRLKLTGGACKDVDGVDQDLLLNFTPSTVTNAGTATAIINGDTIEFTTAGTVFDLLVDSVFKFPCSEQGDSSSNQTSYCVNDITKTGIWQNDDLTMHSGTDDDIFYHNEIFGATKTGVFFIPAEITLSDVATGLDVLGAVIPAQQGMKDTGIELDGTFDSTPELDGTTSTMIADIDLDFSYINSDINPTENFKDLLWFLLTTLSGYPAGERAKILTFTDNNP